MKRYGLAVRCRAGRRPDLGHVYFRSAWEANYARYLNFLRKQGQIIDWRYEAATFPFTAIKRGCRSYTPDFEVLVSDGRVEYHEVKGGCHELHHDLQRQEVMNHILTWMNELIKKQTVADENMD